jgi:hypothetical protein
MRLVPIPVLLCSVAALRAQESRPFCMDDMHPDLCPGPECPCADDRLSIVFDENGSSYLEYGPIHETPIATKVVLEASSPGIQGWSYGVEHDPETLTLEEVTTSSTTARDLFVGGFDATRMDDVVRCTPSPLCQDPTPAAGYISAFVISLRKRVTLPAGSSSVCRARYRPSPDLPSDFATRIQLTEQLAFRGSPPVSINITIDGKSTAPRTLLDGFVTGASPAFRRGDPDGNGRINLSDALSILYFLFLRGTAPTCLETADTNDDGRLDPADGIAVLSWLFLRGPPLASPGTAGCGMDPEDSPAYLGCDAYDGC